MQLKDGDKVIVTEEVIAEYQGKDCLMVIELIEKNAVGVFEDDDWNVAIIRPAEGQEDKFFEGRWWFVHKDKLRKID